MPNYAPNSFIALQNHRDRYGTFEKHSSGKQIFMKHRSFLYSSVGNMGAVLQDSSLNDEAVCPKQCVKVRHIQALMLCLAMALMMAMRVSMSVAVVAMTDPEIEEPFDWSLQKQSIILSSFFWAYFMVQIPVGVLASKVGGRRLLLWGMAINSLISLLTPLAATYGGWQLLCACRVLQGLTQSPLYPVTHYLVSKWAPLEEKGRLTSLIYAGTQLGNGMEMLTAGFLASLWGWPAIFYTLGVLAAIWSAIYCWVGADSPQVSKIISHRERVYIQTSLGHIGGHKTLPTPWKAMFTSLPFYALIVAHAGQSWGYWTLLTEMPSYMKLVLGVDIKASGFLSSLPYFAMYLLNFPMAFLSDLVVKKKWLSITAARKVANTIAHWGPAAALVALSYSPAGNVTAAVALLTLTVALNAGQFTGCMVVHIDMAPNFASQLMGVTNCFSNLVALLAPLSVGHILQDETNPAEWQRVFFLSAGIYFVGNLFFLIFGTSKRLTWNEPDTINEESSTEPSSSKENISSIGSSKDNFRNIIY